MKFEQISGGVFVGFLIILFIVIVYTWIKDEQKQRKKTLKKYSEKNRYNKFSEELSKDLDRYGITQSDQDKIEKLIDKLIKEKTNDEPKIPKVVSSSTKGFLRGAATGLLVDGVSGAAAGGVVFAVINPLIEAIF